MPITRVWKFPTDGYLNTVTMVKSVMGGEVVLSINDAPPLLLRKIAFQDILEHAFQLGSSHCIFRANFGGVFWPSYDFFVNGRSLQTNEAYVPKRSKSALRIVLAALLGFTLGLLFGLLALALLIPLLIYYCVSYQKQKLIVVEVDAVAPSLQPESVALSNNPPTAAIVGPASVNHPLLRASETPRHHMPDEGDQRV